MTPPLPVVAPVRVVLVQPAAAARVGVESTLRQCGCTVTTVESVSAATRSVSSVHPELIVVQAEAVAPAGGEGLVELRAAVGSVPLILLGASASLPEVVEGGGRSCFDDLLLVPLEHRQVQARVSAVRAGARLSDLTTKRRSKVILFISTSASLIASVGNSLELDGYHLLYRHSLLEPLPVTPDLVMVTDEQVRDVGLDVVCRALSRSGFEGIPVFLVCRSSKVMPAGAERVTVISAEAAPEKTLQQVNTVFQRGVGRGYPEPRRAFRCPVEFREAGSTRGWSSALSSEACAGSIVLRTITPPRAGSAVELRIHVRGSLEVVQGIGVVAWANPFTALREASTPVGMGVEFLGLSPERLSRLREDWSAAA